MQNNGHTIAIIGTEKDDGLPELSVVYCVSLKAVSKSLN